MREIYNIHRDGEEVRETKAKNFSKREREREREIGRVKKGRDNRRLKEREERKKLKQKV